MKLKKRVLLQTLSASLALILLLSLMFFLAVAEIRKSALANSEELGDSAAVISAAALEEQLTEKITRAAQDMALILNEKLLKIENHTRTTADIAGSLYTRAAAWRPAPLPYIRSGQMPPADPYIHTAPGVDYRAVAAEAGLAGNIGDTLRQITVVDQGITTSTIGCESGFIIVMDSFPWPSEDFDHRLFPWYTAAKEKGDLCWTDVYLDPRGRGPAISCAMPFYDSSGGARIFKGVARSTVLLSDISKLIDSAGLGRSGGIFLLDGSGLKIVSPGGAQLRADGAGGVAGENYLRSENPRLRSLALSMTLGASGVTTLDMDGTQVFAAYAPAGSLGWSLGVTVPAQEVSAPAWLIGDKIAGLTGAAVADMDRRILFLAGVMSLLLLSSLAFTALLAARFTAGLTGPILALNDGVREVAGGSLDREVVITTGDELQQLAVSFNAMTGRLREHIAETARTAAERERISTELDVAARIQSNMLPVNFPPYPERKNEFDLFAAVYPAKEVGGDFYDFFFIDDDHFTVIIADVSGKGIPAALFMAITMTLIKTRLQDGEYPELALETINGQLCGSNSAGMFVTVWLGVLELSTGRLRYVNAGHNPPLIKRSGSGAQFLTSPPDLVLAAMEDTIYQCRETELESGDTLLLYTDGVTEACGADGKFFGNERLRVFFDEHAALPPKELVDSLRKALVDFFPDAKHFEDAEQSDDITLLALRIPRDEAALAADSLTLPADAGGLRELTAFLERKLKAASCPENVVRQIELAAEEIFVNIARYAYPKRASGAADAGHVDVRCGTAAAGGKTVMTLSFVDSGAPFNPLEREEPDLSLPLEMREAGGLGILIVKRTMDTVHYTYENEMNRLLITKSW